MALQSLGDRDIAIVKNTGDKEVRVHLQEAQSELEISPLPIQQLMLELDRAKNTIDLMGNDLLGKVRSPWLKIKKMFARTA
ncbi:hypothetical protein QUA56_05620 [Microcoleus sp. N3A4]|uniref:hypothetical protein n=1 Tax=Microcoleus sp. N3A4 TaxID=3055379 RepID=UPI002FCEDBFB